MIKHDRNSRGRSLFLYELSDAHEHLGNLLKEASENPDYAEEDLRIDLGHVYAHLNRAWYRRNLAEDFPESDWDIATQFPGDLDPVA